MARELTKDQVLSALDECNWKPTIAAKKLEVGPNLFYAALQRYKPYEVRLRRILKEFVNEGFSDFVEICDLLERRAGLIFVSKVTTKQVERILAELKGEK